MVWCVFCLIWYRHDTVLSLSSSSFIGKVELWATFGCRPMEESMFPINIPSNNIQALCVQHYWRIFVFHHRRRNNDQAYSYIHFYLSTIVSVESFHNLRIFTMGRVITTTSMNANHTIQAIWTPPPEQHTLDSSAMPLLHYYRSKFLIAWNEIRKIRPTVGYCTSYSLSTHNGRWLE